MLTDLPFPETLETLLAQFALLEAGKKACVLVPHWSPQMAPPPGFDWVRTAMGTFYFRGQVTPAEDIEDAVAGDWAGLMLGYGIARKPDEPTGVLALETSGGREIVSILVDEDTREPVWQALAAMQMPGQAIARRTALDVVRARLAWWTDYFNTIGTTTRGNKHEQLERAS